MTQHAVECSSQTDGQNDDDNDNSTPRTVVLIIIAFGVIGRNLLGRAGRRMRLILIMSKSDTSMEKLVR